MTRPHVIPVIEAFQIRARAIGDAIRTFERLAQERLEQEERSASVREREIADRIEICLDSVTR